MKIVSGETMQLIDRRAIDEFGIPGLTLMERAGAGCAEEIRIRFGDSARVAVVVAGKGNNGGDGYVIARYLMADRWNVRTFVLAARDDIGGDAAVNLERLAELSVTFCPEPGDLKKFQAEFAAASVIIDALFGTGLKNPLTGACLEAVEMVNDAGAAVVAVDIPSGVDAGTGKVLGAAVKADLTVTFALPKIGHVLYPGAELCSAVKIVDIGIPAVVMEQAPGYEFLDSMTVSSLIRRRARTDHKGRSGHVLIVAGSTGKSGAAALAANSAVRAGAGLVSLAVPEAIHAILEVKTTEAMTVPFPDNGDGVMGEAAFLEFVKASAGKDAVAIGPGMGSHPQTVRLVHAVMAATVLPLVIDADGLNAVAENPSILLQKKSATVIVTPHPGEMARLISRTVAVVEADRIAVARDFAMLYRVFVILKGARTVIAAPDGAIAINGSGNPGMASGGMGDVLTGILAALLAQGYPPFAACQLGVFLHGLAADLVTAEKGEIGISAVDVQEHLPYAYKELMNYRLKADQCY